MTAIVDHLIGQGLGECAYGVIFGYVIDGLMRDRLRAAGRLPTTELSLERPYWNGAFWAIHPPRAGAAGTNEVSESGVALTMVWTESTVDRLNMLASAPGLRTALRAAVGEGPPDDPVLVIAHDAACSPAMPVDVPSDDDGDRHRLRRAAGRPSAIMPVAGRTGGCGPRCAEKT